MKKFLTVLFIGNCLSTLAQVGTISGKITTSTNKIAAYTTIVIKGSTIGNVADEHGFYQVKEVPAGPQVVIFTAIGYETTEKQVEIKPNETIHLNVVLKEWVTELDAGGVIVTSSRILEHVNDVPSTITLISKKEVERQKRINANLPSILMQKVPSISPSEESQNNFMGKIRGRDVLVLIDGIPQSTPLRNGGRDLKSIDANAIDRIEVINGASAMYGNGATGGIINYITKQPPQNDSFNSTSFISGSVNLAKASETGGYTVSQTFDGKKKSFDYVISGKLSKTGVSRSADGVVISPFYGLGETKTYNALMKVGYDLSDKHRIELMGNYYRSEQDSKYISSTGEFGVSPAIGIKGDSAVNGGTPYNKTLNLKYIGSMKKTDIIASAYYNDFNTVFESFNQIYSTNQGIRLNFNTPFKLGSNHLLSLIYGLDVLKDNTSQQTLDDRFVTPDMDMFSLAPYLQSKFTFFDQWILKAGVRYENIGLKVGNLDTVPGESDQYAALVFNVGIRYNKLKYLQPFASFSQGYSMGDIGLILRRGIPLKSIDAEPVLVNNYEGGVSGRFKFFNYQIAGYYSFSEKGTSFTEVSSGVYDATQLPQKIYGIELILGIQPTKWLHLNSTLGYMDGKQDPKNDDSFDEEIDNANLSPLKITAAADFEITEDLNLMVQMVKIGKRDVFSVEEYNYGKYPITGYTLFDLYASYHWEKLTFTCTVSNLFNTDYFPTYSEVRGANYDGRYYVKGRGAMLNLGVQIRL